MAKKYSVRVIRASNVNLEDHKQISGDRKRLRKSQYVEELIFRKLQSTKLKAMEGDLGKPLLRTGGYVGKNM